MSSPFKGNPFGAIETGSLFRGSPFSADPFITTDPATDALAARMSVAPDGTRIGTIDTLIRALKAAGVWSKLDVLYLTAAHDAQAARLNWISTSYNLTAISSPTFTTDRGYAGDGAASYLDTGYSPSTAALPVNTAGFGFWCRTNSGGSPSNGCRTGPGTSPGLYGSPRFTGDVFNGRINQSTAGLSIAGATTAVGLTTFDRDTAASTTVYRNGVAMGTSTDAATNRPIPSFFLGARNNNGAAEAFDNRQYAALYIAKDTLPAGQQVALYNALAAYMTTVGA